MLYGLEGLIYYIDQDHAEVWYENRMKHLSEIEKAELGLVLKLKPGVSDKLLYLAMLEAGAKLMKVPKYHIYTVDELRNRWQRDMKSRQIRQNCRDSCIY